MIEKKTRKKVINQETQNKEFCYLVQIKSLLTLWIDNIWTEDSDRRLTERNKLRRYLNPNIKESINYCDKIIDELYRRYSVAVIEHGYAPPVVDHDRLLSRRGIARRPTKNR
ncbi:hypothetical protein BpHYR1_004512 [Brachionus plicatilis]|uniref:Uncharacterized protein n=1 Tax=Brachionus plicatilis TaxID=10195 RepID=A0A3M7SJ94_BRAPC|nr:hypothetical protein BpHYR1_004512 [Brachionus plicatilis]